MKLKREIKNERWLQYPYRLAHHPLCDKFANHVYTIKGVKICRGCTNFYSGMIIGLILIPLLTAFLHLNFLVLFALNWGFFIPTVLAVILDPPRIFKDFSRFLLGIGMISALCTVIVGIIATIKDQDYWGAIIAFLTVIIYFVSKSYFSRIRNRRNAAICMACEQYLLPRCDGMKDSYDRAIGLISLEKGDAFSDEET
ncbi:MAG: hypothetical protein ACTSYD_08970 [Candidatus Heimdallarchaeaceae archaeon]